jgi:hypothetical protein
LQAQPAVMPQQQGGQAAPSWLQNQQNAEGSLVSQMAQSGQGAAGLAQLSNRFRF